MAVFQVAELLTSIAFHCLWATLVNLSHGNIYASRTIQALIRRHINAVLTPFLDDIPSFFMLTRDIRAAVIGSTAWNVLSIDNVKPRDLNIVVPNGSQYEVDRLKAYLTCSGLTIDFDGHPSAPYNKCATRFIKLS
ncbi:hypothetical protein BYT27DRAFT_7252951 [Phlegmacium glaucopus]|nr:hypothetical protein BYT27DRAFT_7252951 [Phlegmacium glaucopus]